MMASVLNIGINDEKNKENAFSSSRTEMSKQPCPPTLPSNITPKESYWFAQGGIEEIKPGNDLSNSKSDGDAKEQQLQKDKEERIRLFREHQEAERLKKLKELEQQFMISKKHREQQEEERRRKIEEARAKELERRHQVEERKRQIWEAEQERKEAILRRNMEREARIEARRNAQRNSQCFAFGSSTPRTFDLDLAAIGRSANQGSLLMSSMSGRRSEEREICPPRATSACSLDRKFGEDCMSRSMISLSSSTFRGRKRTDIMPTLTRERSITPHITPRGNQSMRAVSMTRLDQLAQPRRTYHSPRNPTEIATTTANGPRTISPSMSMSMCNLANSSAMGKRRHVNISSPNCKSNMSQSMLHLAGKPSHKDNRHFVPSPTQPKSGMRSAQSMMHLAAPPRLTRAARLRAQALAGNRAASAWNLNKADSDGHYLSPGKDTSRSPSRPQSSMSGNSEISATSSSISGVNMRVRPTPRRPRPVSVAGTISDSTIHTLVKKEFERQPRVQNINASVQKHERAKSASRDKSDIKQVKPLIAPKKPIPPPKSSEVLARAKSHPVPTKDNLRRGVKNSSMKSSLNSENSEEQKLVVNGSEQLDEKIKLESDMKSNISDSDMKPTSPLTSPSVELESFLSSDDSKASVNAEIDSDSVSQSGVDSENKILNLDLVSTNLTAVPASLKEKDPTPQNIPTKIVQQLETISNVLSERSNEVESVNKDFTSAKPRITSEEEARAALAEKRRLAREQAEREAELERQRLEEIRKIEEEQRKLEEAEQKRMEEEQIRLAKLHRELEEEKLRRAIEEREQRDREEQEKKDEEARLKAEREEQERKAREEAEKQRLELEDKLRKEEEERAERKRRVEQIMARTRGKSAQSPSGSINENNFKSAKNTESSNNNAIDIENKSASSKEIEQVPNGSEQGLPSEKSSMNNGVNNDSKTNTSSTYEERLTPLPLPDLLNSERIANHTTFVTNGQHTSNEENLSKNNASNSFSLLSNKTTSANAALSPQSNGYGSHEEMSCTTSPDENEDTSLLIDVQSCELKTSKLSSNSTDFTKLVDLEPPSLDNENFLINVDDFNSNLLNSGNSFVDFDDSRQKDKPVVDLLS